MPYFGFVMDLLISLDLEFLTDKCCHSKLCWRCCSNFFRL